MRLGLALPHYCSDPADGAATWERVARVARAAEQFGFSSVWVSDHLFVDWGKYGADAEPQGSLECWTTLSALAAVTSTIRLGSLTLCNDFRNPALVAKMAASLDVLSGGRLDIGMGAGWYQREYEAAGLDFASARRRIERLGEAVQIVGRMLEGEELSFTGQHYSMDGAIARPLPVQHPRPPLWVGGKGDRLLEVVARVADGWNLSWLGTLEWYRERLGAAARACEKAGRDPRTLRRSVGAYMLCGRDDRDLTTRWERLVERTPSGVLSGEAGRPIRFEDWRRTSFAGTVEEVLDDLGRLADLGVEEVIVSLGALPFQIVDEDDVALVGTRIASALRSHQASIT
ncbi:MAG: LLM class flavin-dependent oxidoreductase [Actinobacteria bacterium]|nr:LLM class flavin-dependent oxidoreductase [Actinomycetota bacterium]